MHSGEVRLTSEPSRPYNQEHYDARFVERATRIPRHNHRRDRAGEGALHSAALPAHEWKEVIAQAHCDELRSAATWSLFSWMLRYTIRHPIQFNSGPKARSLIVVAEQ